MTANENFELAAQFRMPPTKATNQAFVTLVGDVKKTTELKDLLVSRGLSEKLLDDLTASLGEFEQTLEATRARVRDHVGASAELRSVVSEISQQVRLLDGLVRYRFGDNAELMGAWLSIRNVTDPHRSHAEPAPVGDTPEVVKTAA